jgi:hypothetical protein
MEKETPVLSELITFRVPVYVHQQVCNIATERQKTISVFMREVLSNQLEKQKT